jgi:hypothetical protein
VLFAQSIENKTINNRKIIGMNKTLKVGGSCGLGALFGTLIALLLSPWLWWVGALAGGVVAYIAYDFNEIIQVVPVAWKAVSEFNWKRFFWDNETFFHWYVVAFTALLAITGMIFGNIYLVGKVDDSAKSHWLMPLLSMVGSFLFLSFVIAILVECETESQDWECRLRRARFASRYFNPVVAPFAIAIFTLIGLWWCLKRMPGFVVLLCKFSWKLFIMVHSEMRALCFVDAFLGATFGAFYGYHSHAFALAAIIGAVSGALLGIVNYQIVSIRWLKLRSA